MRIFSGLSSSVLVNAYRRRLLTLVCALGSLLGVISPYTSWANDKVANLAMVGEPQSLDPMQSTADLVGTIMQHVYETLYTYDGRWQIVPMLADKMPTIEDQGLSYTIPLRTGVKLHNGRDMNAEDVIASLQRWMEMTPRGKAVAKEVAQLSAKDANTIVLRLNKPYAPLLAQLALPSGMAAIMAKESIATPLVQFIGTGPYQFKERQPDKYTILTQHKSYTARKEPANGYGGRREAIIEELRFIPVPNLATRLEGVLAGQFHYADQLSTDSISRLESNSKAVVPIVIKNYGFPYMVFNTKEGVMNSQGLRLAVQTALGHKELMQAAFSDERFFIAEPNFFTQGTPYYSDKGSALYNQRKSALAKEQSARGGYKGQPIRVMASRQYEFHYNMALVLTEQLKQAGFEVDLQVVDWATLVQRRNDPKLWDIYITHSGLLPEPMLSPPQLGDGAPGWWDTPAKKARLTEFNQEVDLNKRATLWGNVQQVVYDEVPYVIVGKFNSLAARSSNLAQLQPAIWPFFWNAKLNP